MTQFRNLFMTSASCCFLNNYPYCKHDWTVSKIKISPQLFSKTFSIITVTLLLLKRTFNSKEDGILKIGHSQPLFSLFMSWKVNKLLINISDDWIWTADEWLRKQPVCQLSHRSWYLWHQVPTLSEFFTTRFTNPLNLI